ncbi:helix-turn-helix transcriptional regulator, partial [Enterococcus xiangfangensis]|uniref:helix-turn-helix transcriptional regulator n=1 Tax=Enterococcus xiangfangensis TaxID=1296537 RepID=UPI003D1706FF|nr:XRE family transcriptional regulator [Enterococcus asini]
MDLSLLLKKYRIKNELTQEQLAKKMYVSHQTISKWETGIGTCNSLVNSRLDYLFSSPQIVEESS